MSPVDFYVLRFLDFNIYIYHLYIFYFPFAIETGRHDRIPEEIRICPLCEDGIENELHFLLTCPTCTPIRKTFFKNIQNLIPDFHELGEPQKFTSIMTNLDNTAAKFIRDCFELRTFLLAEHKIND